VNPRPFLVPWPVVEVVALRLARHEVRSVGVRDDVSGRIAEAAGMDGVVVREEGSVDAIVCAGDGLTPCLLARARVLEHAADSLGEVIVCEPSVPGTGLGLSMLRRIDPLVTTLTCDELPDALGGTRQRKPWEAAVAWLVAEAAAWRFAPGAEEVRTGFRARLPRLRVPEMILACRRMLHRFDNAYEPFALAAEELGRRGDPDGVRQLLGELELSPRAVPGVRGRVRRALVSCSGGRSLEDVG
jgi:hypothetical protein